MTNYTKTTDFAAKDALPSGNSAKIVKGSEIDTEFNNIATASATKANKNNAALTGTTTFETISDGTIAITAFVDEDNMASNSATLLPTQQSVKAYVDSQVTAQDLDFQADTGGALSIDLDSETFTLTGGTGIDTSGLGNAVTFAIDSTVATLTGSQTLSNKTLSAPVVSGNLTTDGLIDGRDVATDGTKLDGIESGATADQTAAEIKTAYESNANTNAFTDADESKLDGIEALADVTDTANVTAAGALMDSELTNITAVKALNQGVATTDSPTFAGLTTAGLTLGATAITATGTELNYVDGVTSAIQTQLDSKAPTANPTFTGSFTSPGIDDNADAIAITIDSSERVLINTTTEGYADYADNLTIADSDNAGITIRSGATSDGSIYFSDATTGAGEYDGYIAYAHNGQYLRFGTSGTEGMRIDSSGNVGIGVTPSSWNSIFKSVQIGSADPSFIAARTDGPSQIHVGVNAYYDAGGSWRYINSDYATRNYQSSGSHYWETASSGTAGNAITFTQAMTLDASGNLGIGGTTTTGWANKQLVLDAGANASAAFVMVNDTTGRTGTDGSVITLSGSDMYLIQRESANMIFRTANTERMRIDSSGNLLVGKTASGLNTAGFEVASSGRTRLTRDSANVVEVNRTSNNGSLVTFNQDGTAVGSIGSNGGDVYIGTGDTTIRFADGDDAVIPRGTSGAARDGAIDLGISNNRFKDIYATNGTIQTSDRNEKQNIEALSDAEQRVAVAAKGLLRKFRWISSVEAKGDDARIHFGIIAQDLQAAFEAEGLDAGRYGMFINTTWTDEETGEERSRMGVRYSELLAFIIAAI